MLIRSINQSDNKSLSVILREVLVEMKIPQKGSAYEDPELDNMYEAYQFPRSKYFVVEEDKKVLGGAITGLALGGQKSINFFCTFFSCYLLTPGQGPFFF